MLGLWNLFPYARYYFAKLNEANSLPVNRLISATYPRILNSKVSSTRLYTSSCARLSIYQSIIAENLNFGRKHTEPILARVEPAVFLVESSLSDSALSPLFPIRFRGFIEAGQVSKEP